MVCTRNVGLENSLSKTFHSIYKLIFFGHDKTFYGPCPSLAGIDTHLCCQAGHRDASLVVKYALVWPAEQTTESRAK